MNKATPSLLWHMNFVTLSYLQKFVPSHKVQTPFVTACVQSTEISNVWINVSHVYSMKIIFMLYSVRLVSFLSPVQDPQSGLLHSSQVALSFTCFSSNLNIHMLYIMHRQQYSTCQLLHYMSSCNGCMPFSLLDLWNSEILINCTLLWSHMLVLYTC